ncbi:hypothetical protein PAPHI01_1219 [Pancytospora philotis]|nr:hypothetical protein PAPHI01_1219 [Pancytospora philotis]
MEHSESEERNFSVGAKDFTAVDSTVFAGQEDSWDMSDAEPAQTNAGDSAPAFGAQAADTQFPNYENTGKSYFIRKVGFEIGTFCDGERMIMTQSLNRDSQQ